MSNSVRRLSHVVSFSAAAALALTAVAFAPVGSALASERPAPAFISATATHVTAVHVASDDPQFLLSPVRGRAGKNIKFTGFNYGAAETVTVTFIDKVTGETVLGKFPTDANGTFFGIVTIPKDATQGRQKIEAEGTTSHIRDTARFKVR